MDVYPERQSINPKYRLVPFARKISGDQYCFLYEDGEDEPKVVLYGHDTGNVDLWANSFEEFPWLNDEHQELLAEVPIQDIWEQLPEPQEFNIWV